MISTSDSRNGVPIRLSDERWAHIEEEHGELVGMQREVLETIAQADRVLEGTAGELLALRMIDAGKAMVVVYKEVSSDDGFIITAFLTRRLASLNRRKQLWPPRT